MSEIENYVRAASLQEACSLLQDPDARVIAGGTDILLKAKAMKAPSIHLVDISDICELRGIRAEDGGVRIGAVTRLGEIVRSPLLQTPALRALVQGALLVGSPQIRNLATLGGNLCNAAPSADTSAPLLVLEGCAEVESPAGRYSLPLEKFFIGPGRTVLKPGELLASIFIPNPASEARAVYLKHSPRRAMDLAVVGVAALLVDCKPRQVRIALGAVAPTPMRACEVEQFLKEASALDDATIQQAAAMAAQAARPISDVRSSAEYRTWMVESLARRALQQIVEP
jgi:carbon-monoxide dehydrogenase medium subunit